MPAIQRFYHPESNNKNRQTINAFIIRSQTTKIDKRSTLNRYLVHPLFAPPSNSFSTMVYPFSDGEPEYGDPDYEPYCSDDSEDEGDSGYCSGDEDGFDSDDDD